MARAVYQIFVGSFGGLDGIAEKLQHIESLGAEAIYLTPIFRAPSPHKYDTADFDAIDDSFGGAAAFERLVAAVRKRHLGLIVDGVFNRVGDQHRWAREKPFLRGTVWRGHSSLPELDLRVPSLRAELFGPDGVVARWTRRGVTGWRLGRRRSVESRADDLGRAPVGTRGAKSRRSTENICRCRNPGPTWCRSRAWANAARGPRWRPAACR